MAVFSTEQQPGSVPVAQRESLYIHIYIHTYLKGSEEPLKTSFDRLGRGRRLESAEGRTGLFFMRAAVNKHLLKQSP